MTSLFKTIKQPTDEIDYTDLEKAYTNLEDTVDSFENFELMSSLELSLLGQHTTDDNTNLVSSFVSDDATTGLMVHYGTNLCKPVSADTNPYFYFIIRRHSSSLKPSKESEVVAAIEQYNKYFEDAVALIEAEWLKCQSSLLQLESFKVLVGDETDVDEE